MISNIVALRRSTHDKSASSDRTTFCLLAAAKDLCKS